MVWAWKTLSPLRCKPGAAPAPPKVEPSPHRQTQQLPGHSFDGPSLPCSASPCLHGYPSKVDSAAQRPLSPDWSGIDLHAEWRALAEDRAPRGWGEETYSHQQLAAINRLLITAKVSGGIGVLQFRG